MPRPSSSTVTEPSLLIVTRDLRGVAGHRLVDRVVDDFVDQVVQAADARCRRCTCRPLADVLQVADRCFDLVDAVFRLRPWRAPGHAGGSCPSPAGRKFAWFVGHTDVHVPSLSRMGRCSDLYGPDPQTQVGDPFVGQQVEPVGSRMAGLLKSRFPGPGSSGHDAPRARPAAPRRRACAARRARRRPRARPAPGDRWLRRARSRGGPSASDSTSAIRFGRPFATFPRSRWLPAEGVRNLWLSLRQPIERGKAAKGSDTLRPAYRSRARA